MKFVYVIAALAASAIPLRVGAEKPPAAEFQIGLAGGGAPGLLFDVPHVREVTTERWTGVLRARLRFPKVTPRTLEVYAVNLNGAGLNLKNDDFRFGKLRVHLLDVGIFWNYGDPVSVARVDREFDVTFGTGIAYRYSRRVSFTLDHRLFFPLNVFKVLTDYGDFARLVGIESLQGGQTWLGAYWRF